MPRLRVARSAAVTPIVAPSVSVHAEVVPCVHARTERAFTPDEIHHEREEGDPRDVATGEILSARVQMDHDQRHVTIERAYRRHLGVAQKAETADLWLTAKNWPHFVALVNELDRQIRSVEAKLG